MSAKVEMGCSAVVTVTLQVRGKGHWGADATVEEVMRIGGRETVSSIESMIHQARLDHIDVKMIGEPQIGAVTWERVNK